MKSSETKLTPRQYDILYHSAYGLSGQEIADKLGISLNTVKGHRKLMMERLEVNRISQAVAIAMQRGLLP